MPRFSTAPRETPCAESKSAASAAGGADAVAASGACSSKPTRPPPPHIGDAQVAQSTGARTAARGAANSGQSSTPGGFSWIHTRMQERALRRASRGPNGWEMIPLGSLGCLGVRSPTEWPQAWRNWLEDEPWALQMPTIQQSVSKVSDLPVSDSKYTVGSVIAPCKNQYNLMSRSGEGVLMGEVTERVRCHPYVKKLAWGNQKLTPTNTQTHENAWNVQLTTVEDVKAVMGLTRHGLGKDPQGRQKTHYWIGQFSENIDATVRGRLVDLLLNAAGYRSWFGKYGREWMPKSPIVAQSEVVPVMPNPKPTENDGPPVAPGRELVDSDSKALTLSAVTTPGSMTGLDCPLDTEVEQTVRERVTSKVSPPHRAHSMYPPHFAGSVPSTQTVAGVGTDEYHESTALEDTPPVARDRKQVSFSEPPVVCHPVIEPALTADVSGGGSERCGSCPQLLYEY